MELRQFTLTQFSNPDYLATHGPRINAEAIATRRQQMVAKRVNPRLHSCFAKVNCLPMFKSQHVNFDQATVTIGHQEEIKSHQIQLLDEALQALIPWKKGPFNVFGHAIDAEWRSDLKWQRLLAHLDPLTDKKIADIGCNNGYFMFRMAATQPELVIGFDPNIHYWLKFQLLQRFTQLPNLHYELLGVEQMDLYPTFFDVVFCLGILYHHINPLELLRKIHGSMNSGAQLIVDCQGIPGDEPISLTPRDRYARSRGIWFLPTPTALENWLHRCSFREIETVFCEPLSPTEQRTTAWAPIASLREFLDADDPTKTEEGYPAPWRIYVKARK